MVRKQQTQTEFTQVSYVSKDTGKYFSNQKIKSDFDSLLVRPEKSFLNMEAQCLDRVSDSPLLRLVIHVTSASRHALVVAGQPMTFDVMSRARAS